MKKVWILFGVIALIALATVVFAVDGKMGLNWTANSEPDLDHYNVYRSLIAGGPYTKTNIDPILNPNYLDIGLPDSTTYYYVVTAVDVAGNESGYSEEASATIPDLTPPAPPVGLTIQPEE